MNMGLRTMLPSCLVLASLLSVSSMARQWELQVGPEIVFPKGDLWESPAWGAEVKGIYWLDKTDKIQIGFAAFTGLAQWSAGEKVTREGGTITDEWSGHAQLIPLGVSLLNRLEIGKKMSARVELGLCYVNCGADIRMARRSDDGFGGTLSQDYEIDCGNGFVGRIGGALEWAMKWGARPAKVVFSGGYQFDVPKSDLSGVDWTQTKSQDLELAGFFIGVGLLFPI